MRLEAEDGAVELAVLKAVGAARVGNLVAGARGQRYQALITALDILSSGPHSMTVRARLSAP